MPPRSPNPDPHDTLRALLDDVARGALSTDQALQAIAVERDLGFARLDVERARRKGFPETIYCPGKTPEQVRAIARALLDAGQNVMATRADETTANAFTQAFPEAVYHARARVLTVDIHPRPDPIGQVVVVSAGTADEPVAEEAAITAERVGAKTERLYDVGVAGLHRVLRHVATLRAARALVVVAGMEGALPSVVSGLVDRPIIAVPTSVGYGAHMQGLTPLLAMLNSCAPGVSVVNIDNGYGAGVCAALINRIAEGL